MRKMIAILFLLSICSTWAISLTLGHCVYLYTGSLFYACLFDFSLSFLLGLIVSQYVIDKFVRPIFYD